MFTSSNNPDFKQLGQKLTNNLKEALLQSFSLAKEFGYFEISGGHLLYAIYLRKGSVGSNILSNMGLQKKFFREILLENSPQSKISAISPAVSPDMKKIITKSFSIAREFGYPYVGTEHLVYSLLESKDPFVKKILSHPDIRQKNQSLQEVLRAAMEPDILSNLSKMLNMPEITTVKNKQAKSSATPFVDKFCLDINEETRKNKETIIGRFSELRRMINILGRKNKNNPLLVGDPGVGKTALVAGLAQMINTGDVPNSLYRKRIMNLDVAQLIAGTSFRGEFESRLKEIIKEIKENKNIILFIDEIHNIVGAGNVAGSLDLANILKPALARGELQLIGATTHEEFKKHIEKDAALERRFQPIRIQEPSVQEAKTILFGIKSHYEDFHNVSLSDETLELAVDLSFRYVQNRFLPDKAIDVIDETASDIRSKSSVSDFIRAIKKIEDEKIAIMSEKEKLVTEENFEAAIGFRAQEKELEKKLKLLQQKQSDAEKQNRIEIRPADIIDTISKISGIPGDVLSRQANDKIKNIKKILALSIIGQADIIEKLSNTLLRTQTGIGNPDRPLGSFLFLGPTGVGKTLTAKILAREYFGPPAGGKKSLIRIDMSELMERHNVSSLIGSPAGYIGYGEGGNLTEKVRRNPYAVVLFDEIEKAHPDVFNILLQILEDGTLTDAEGTQVSFKNTIVILTSNIGTDEFTNASQVGFEQEILQPADKSRAQGEKFNKIKELTLKDLEKKVRPELLNRMDHILVFDSLGEKEIRKISELELNKLKERLKRQGLEFIFDKKTASFIASKSLAFNQGARLVRKNIQEMLENKIAEMIVYDKIKNGKINISIKGKEVIFS